MEKEIKVMEKGTNKQSQENRKKSLIKKILIGVGIVGASILTISLIRRTQKKNECQNLRIANEPICPEIPKAAVRSAPIKKKVSAKPPMVKKKFKPQLNEEAAIRKCNKLLNTLWKIGNPDNKLYYDDFVEFNIKNCPFAPFITKRDLWDQE